MYTGDRAFLDECTPTLERLFNYYAFLAGPGDEVLQDLDRQNAAYCFLDHGPIDRQGLVTGLNAIYCRALLSGAWLLKEMDQPDAAHQLRKRAGAVAHRVRDLTWDAERGLFADGWKNGEMSDFYSWQTNVLAIYGGIAEASAYDSIFDKIFSDEEPYELFAAGATNNPFFKYFILEAAFALGRRTWAVNMLRWYWGGMIARGAKTWWEFFDPEGNPEDAPDGSMCHGYGTSPNGFLCAEVAGVRPAKPGFTTIYFNPLVGVTDWVKCQVPTPYGRINAEWSRGDDGHLEAVIDSNYPLEVVPMLSADLAASATIHVSESVSILAEQA
jgi:hypothetical protein